MTLKKKIISGVATMAFLAMMALNIQLIQPPGEETHTITLESISAMAQSGSEGTCLGGTFRNFSPTTNGLCNCNGQWIYKQNCYVYGGYGCTVIDCEL